MNLTYWRLCQLCQLILYLNKRTFCVFLVLILFALSPFTSTAQTSQDFLVCQSGFHPSISVDGTNLCVAWVDTDGIYIRQFDMAGNAIGIANQIINEPFLNDVNVTLSNGLAMLAWRDISFSFSSYIIGQIITPAGTAVSTLNQINDNYSDAERYQPLIASLTDSTFLVVWIGSGPQKPAGQYGVWGQILSDSLQHLGNNLLLSELELNVKGGPALAFFPASDRFLVSWRDSVIRYRMFSKNGAPLASSHVVQDSLRLRYWNPSAGIDSSGIVTLTWGAQRLDSTWAVYKTRIDSQGSMIEEATFVAGNVLSAVTSSVAVDADGKSVIAFEMRVNGQYLLRAQRFDEDGVAFGPLFPLSSRVDTAYRFRPNVVMRNGQIYATWITNDSINARIIDFSDPLLSIEYSVNRHPQNFVLFNNYPNPFNPTTTVSFSLETDEYVKIAVFDLSGRTVSSLFEGSLRAGTYSIPWKTPWSLSSGVYFCRLSTKSRSQTIRMSLVR